MVSLDTIPQLLASGLMVGLIYGLVGLCFHLGYNTTKIVNFATGEFVVLGSLLLFTFNQSLGINLAVAFVLMLIAATAIGILFERVVIFPLHGQPHLVPVIATLGATFVFRIVFMIIWGTQALFVPSFSGDTPMTFMGAMIQPQALWIAISTLLILAAVWALFRFTMFGKALHAVSLNEQGVKIIGVNITMVTLYVFVLTAVLSAAAGGLMAPITSAKSDLGVAFSLKGMAASFLGGITNPAGAVIGGILIGILEALVAGILSSVFRDAAIFSVVIVILALRPAGLFGRPEMQRV